MVDQPFTHLDGDGRPRMVDVTAKEPTLRRAEASCLVVTAVNALSRGGEPHELDPVFAARLAGVQAAKRTSTLIPLCHPLPLTDVQVDVERDPRGLVVRARVATVNRTGVEMEALTACAFASLSLVNALVKLDPQTYFEEMLVLRKSGGQSGDWGRRSDPASEG